MSYYTVEVKEIDVIGVIWMPAVTAAYTVKIREWDLQNIGELTRDNISKWLDTHTGDFQYITDFRVDIKDVMLDWENPESEYIFNDCMYGSEE